MTRIRTDIENKFKWDLSSIITNDHEWENLYTDIGSKKDILLKYKGKLNQSDKLLECLNEETLLSREISRLYVYAKMKSDEDTSVSTYMGMVERAEMLIVSINSINSFITPEITAIDKAELERLASLDNFSDYSVFLRDIIRNKEHILQESEEKILAEAGTFSSVFHDVFNVLNNADITFDKIKNSEGKLVELSHGSYSELMQNEDRAVRKRAFIAYYKSFKQLKNTIASNYAGNVKKNCFYAKVRKFNSAIEHSMNSENVPKDVYNSLLKAVGNNVNVVHDYVKLRKEMLGLKKIEMYDLYVPLIKGADLKYDYDKAFEIVLEALQPLGQEYIDMLKQAYSNNWIDVYETKNKRSGAYAWGVFDAHPYVLLNYKKTTHDIFTIAHELGHAMHSYYSNKTQPYPKAGYEIFVAEVASTVNELLLLRHLSKTKDKDVKKYLLTYMLDTFRTTLFRQTMFAEFEMKAHEMYEKGLPLTTDNLSDMYYELNIKYYDKEVSTDDIRYEWARIPHFYSSFYVYKYATGLTSACMIVDKLLSEPDYLPKYYQFLKAGCSLPPVDILKLCDVDLMTEKPYEQAMKLFSQTLEELKSLL